MAGAQEGGPDYGPLGGPTVELQAVVLPDLVVIDGEPVPAALDLPVWVAINGFEHAHVWHNEDGRDNLYGGGLQFYLGTWRSMGCTVFAPYPAAASIADQIECGRWTLTASSWAQQWPRSSRAAGLR